MFLMSLLLVSNMAHAADVAGATDADRSACRTRASQNSNYLDKSAKDNLMTLCLQDRVAKREADTLTSQIRTQQESRQDCYGNRRTWNPTTWVGNALSSQAAIDSCNAANAALEARVEELNNSLKLQQQGVTKAEAAFNAASGGAQATEAARKEVDRTVVDEFNTMKLSIFSNLLQGSGAEAKLNKMARALDNSAMGLYLRDRMAGVLNSDALCVAAKECKAGKKTARSVTGKDLNSVFSSKMTTTARDVSNTIQAPAAAPVSTGK